MLILHASLFADKRMGKPNNISDSSENTLPVV